MRGGKLRAASAFLCALLLPVLGQIPVWDVIVYGATPAGVLAAVAAAGEDARVLLLEPRVSVGGAISGGLCVTDTGTTTAVIGGRTLRFFEAVANATPGARAGEPLYRFQPKIAEGVFESWLQSAGVTLATEARITSLLTDGVSRRVTQALLANGSLVSGRVWVDSTY